VAPRQDLTIAAPAPGDRLLSLSCSGSRLSALWSDGTLRCYSTADASTDAADESVAAPVLEMRLKGFCIPSGQQARFYLKPFYVVFYAVPRCHFEGLKVLCCVM